MEILLKQFFLVNRTCRLIRDLTQIKVTANLFGLEFRKILKSYQKIAHYIYFVLKKNYLKTFFLAELLQILCFA